MKNILLLILIATTSNIHSQKFNIESYKFDVNNKVVSVAYCDDKFYCLESNGNILSIDSLSNITNITKASQSSTSIININDSLFVKTKTDSVFHLKDNKLFYIKKKKINIPFYEDENYFVETTCSGEWGGSIYFTDKLNKKKYECSATCVIIVNKLNESYLVTASLAHLATSTQILQIDDPKELTLFKKRKRKKINYVGDNESKVTHGAKILIDVWGYMTISSFIYNNQLFHIVVGQLGQGTTLCKIIDNKFEVIAKISDDRFSSYNPVNIRYKKGETLSVFQNHNSNGFLFIDGNNIKLYSFSEKDNFSPESY